MGRSVLTATNATTTLYFDASLDPDDYDGFAEADLAAQWAWDDFVGNLTSTVPAYFPSMGPEDTWENQEIHYILGNDLCKIGVSEYCGIVSVSIVPKNQCEYCWRPCDCDPLHNLATAWTAKNAAKIAQVIIDHTGWECYSKAGTFSDGTSVYTKRTTTTNDTD